MGVKECCRSGCEDIMCDEYNNIVGYICYECKTELENSNPTSFADVLDFMRSPKAIVYEDEEGFSLDLVFQ